MDINILENLTINWKTIPEQKSTGITGFVISKTVEFQSFKIRQLHLSANYEADHWCEKGHIIHVIDGELIIEYNDQTTITISKENSLILGDNISFHKAKTEIETQVLIID